MTPTPHCFRVPVTSIPDSRSSAKTAHTKSFSRNPTLLCDPAVQLIHASRKRETLSSTHAIVSPSPSSYLPPSSSPGIGYTPVIPEFNSVSLSFHPVSSKTTSITTSASIAPNLTTSDTTTAASSIGANSNSQFPFAPYGSSSSPSTSGLSKPRYTSLNQDIASLVHTASDVGASPSISVSGHTWIEISRPTAQRSSSIIPAQSTRRPSFISSAVTSTSGSDISTLSPSAGSSRDPSVPLSSDGVATGIDHVSTASSTSAPLLQTIQNTSFGLDESRTDSSSGVGTSAVSSGWDASYSPRIMTSTIASKAWETAVVANLDSSSLAAPTRETLSADARDLPLPSNESTPPSSVSRTTPTDVQPTNIESSDLLTFPFYGVTPGPSTSSGKMSAIYSAPELPTTTPLTLTSISLSTTDVSPTTLTMLSTRWQSSTASPPPSSGLSWSPSTFSLSFTPPTSTRPKSSSHSRRSSADTSAGSRSSTSATSSFESGSSGLWASTTTTSSWTGESHFSSVASSGASLFTSNTSGVKAVSSASSGSRTSEGLTATSTSVFSPSLISGTTLSTTSLLGEPSLASSFPMSSSSSEATSTTTSSSAQSSSSSSSNSDLPSIIPTTSMTMSTTPLLPIQTASSAVPTTSSSTSSTSNPTRSRRQSTSSDSFLPTIFPTETSSGSPVSISISMTLPTSSLTGSGITLTSGTDSGSTFSTTGATDTTASTSTSTSTSTSITSSSSSSAETNTSTSTTDTTATSTSSGTSTSSSSFTTPSTTPTSATSTTSTTSTTTTTLITTTSSSFTSLPPLTSSSGVMETVSATITDTATNTVTRTQPRSTTTDFETLTTIQVTTQMGHPTTVTSVVIVPSGSLNPDGGDNKRSKRDHRTLSKGTIAAISLISIFAVATTILWLMFAMRRRHRRQQQRDLAAIGGRRSFDYGAAGLTGLTAGRSGRNVRRGSSGDPIRTAPLEDEDADLERDMNSGSGEMQEVGGGLGAVRRSSYGSEFLVPGTARLRGGISPGDHDERRVYGRDPSPTSASHDQVTDFRNPDLQPGDANLGLSEGAALANAAFAAQRRRSSLPSIYSSGVSSPVVVHSLYPHTEGRRASFSITPYSQSNVQPEERTSAVTFAEPGARPSTGGSGGSSRPGSRDSHSGAVVGFGEGEVAGAVVPDSKRSSYSHQRSRGSSSLNVRGQITIPPPPPSAWTAGEKGKERANFNEVESAAAMGDPIRGSDVFDNARSRSSFDMSSSGHGHGGNFVVTSSQGHGSATGSGSGSNEKLNRSQSQELSSGSGSVGHSGESSQNRDKTRRRSKDISNEQEGSGIFSRASLSGLRSRFRRSLDASPRKQNTNVPRPSPQPVSSLQVLHPPKRASTSISIPASFASSSAAAAHSRSHPNLGQFQHLRASGARPSGPVYGLVAPGPGEPPLILLPPRPSSLLRSQLPGQIPNFPPPPAPSALLRTQGPGTGLSVIEATPADSPAQASEGYAATTDGLLDPGLATRLRELRGGQASLSTLGLRDNEDYSRPIGGLVKNRQDSSTTISSHYSQPADNPQFEEDRIIPDS